MTDDANVRRTREKVLSGELPKMDCRMTWYGPGRDGKCMACDQAIGAHEVEVECDLPNGGTIRFHQRCYTIWPRYGQAARKPNSSLPRMPVTIVLADGSPDCRLIVQTVLSSMGLITVVGEAADGWEALALVHRERPDLLITDLVMPHLNGIELTRRVRAEFRRR